MEGKKDVLLERARAGLINNWASIRGAGGEDTCHKIRGWFGWEGTFEGHLVHPPCDKQGHFQPA